PIQRYVPENNGVLLLPHLPRPKIHPVRVRWFRWSYPCLPLFNRPFFYSLLFPPKLQGGNQGLDLVIIFISPADYDSVKKTPIRSPRPPGQSPAAAGDGKDPSAGGTSPPVQW